MTAFWMALGVTFWAEMGDKTQFIALAYAARYRTSYVIAGILWGVAVMMLIAVFAGKVIGALIPRIDLQIIAALCFLGFAFHTLFSKDHEGHVQTTPTRHPIFAIGLSFILAELGDKTMLTTLTLATTRPWFPIWLGATSGMALADGIGIGLGRWIGKHIPPAAFKWGTFLLFLAFGLWTGFEVCRQWKMGLAG